MSDTSYDHDTLLAFVQGKLPEAKVREINTASQSSRELAAEIALMRGVISAQQNRAEEASTTEFGWARLSKAIDQSATNAEPSTMAQGPRFALWQVAAAAMAAVAVWQTLAVPLLTRTDEPGTAYIPVTAEDIFENQARVVFRDGTTEAEMRQLLRDVDASIIDGPSAIGLYTLSFSSPEARSQALEVMEASNSPVEIVQID